MLINQKVLFSKEECRSIIDFYKTSPREWTLNDRKYNSYLIKYDNENKWIFDKLSEYFESETGLKIIKMKNEIHFHKFIKNDWFNIHNDNRSGRIYAVGVCLNDDFSGGNFKLYNPNEIILEKVIGNTYVFDVRIDHEITLILDGERYSLLWFLQNEHIKFKKNVLI